MEKKIMQNIGSLNTALSFQPLFRTWEKVIGEGRIGLTELYRGLLDKVNQHPELLKPIENLEIIKNHMPLIEQIMATIFPVTLSSQDDYFAASLPYTFNTFYSSDRFKNTFLNEKGEFVHVPDEGTAMRLFAEKKASAYQLILKQLYGIEMSGQVKSVHPYKCPRTGLEKFMEVELDTRFVDVVPTNSLPSLPEDCKEACFRITDILSRPDMMEWLPLEEFSFEGIALVMIREVTEREVINNIKNSLLTLQSYSDVETFRQLQNQFQDLVGVADVHIGITPFFYVNDELVLSDLHNSGSIFLKNLESQDDKEALVKNLQQLFIRNKGMIVIPEINDESTQRYTFLQHIKQQGWGAIILCPLYSDKRLVGTLEIVTEHAGTLNYDIIPKIEPAIPLFELAVQKSADNLDAQLDKIIKEQFTAVQSSVEWRFTQASLNYITKVQHNEDTKIESIVFDNVYPLYGAIDVRNSSAERNLAIQKDLLEQLEMAGAIVKKARKHIKYPLLKEVDYKIRKYIHSVSNIVLSDDEISINHFLKEEIVQLFQHLSSVTPALKDDIAQYFVAVSSVVDMLYHHRKNFDDSITYINNAVAKFIDKVQHEAQQIYPHYFERFVTDGVDFNIYIGQSISPHIPFNDFYLKNLKMWQLTILVRAAQLTKLLESDIAVPLQTTQLILAHSHPISISFRPAERKFDVDGAYNIRYEIIKKRIDKVHIKDTNERLTKPGTLAIVYTKPSEANEYLEYIEFLQHEGLCTTAVEHFELEELQGVSGLKALRVGINSADKLPVKEKAEMKEAASAN